MIQIDEHGYFQRRVREEIARCTRFRDLFSLVVLEAAPPEDSPPNRRATLTAARQLEHRLRTCDIVAAVNDETIAIMLVGTGPAGVREAEHRIRHALTSIGGVWRLVALSFPEQDAEILTLDILSAA